VVKNVIGWHELLMERIRSHQGDLRKDSLELVHSVIELASELDECIQFMRMYEVLDQVGIDERDKFTQAIKRIGAYIKSEVM